MDINKLHEQFKGDDSPSVEGQIRWLQKQGFGQHQIDQAMIQLYKALDHGEIPQVCNRLDGKNERVYRLKGETQKVGRWDVRKIKDGFELDQVLLELAKRVRTEELGVIVKNVEKFEHDMRKRWEKANKIPIWKRIFRR